MLDKKIEAFIRDRAGDVGHSGRTFYDHLIGVYDLLESIGAAERVCLAGLFHSIYGTNAFRHQAVSLDERHDVAKLIGYPAERLAYIFCSCARPRALIEAVDRGAPYFVLDRRNGKRIGLTRDELDDLLEIEDANLLEQNSLKMMPQVTAARLLLMEVAECP